MFDIGWGELVVIGIVALIAIGPKELPTVMRSLGHWMGKIRRMASEFQGQFQEALREAEMDDLKKEAESLTSAITDATKFDPLADIDNDGDADFDAVEPVKLEPENPEPEKPEPATTDAAADTAEPSHTASSEPEKQSDAEAQPPEPPALVAEQELAPAEPPPKQAGGKA